MHYYPRKASIMVLLALFIGILTTTIAQDESSLEVVGSGQVIESVLATLAETSDNGLKIIPQITGTDEGAQRFCAGDVSLFAATHPLTNQEESICVGNEIDFTEYLLGYDILAIVTHAELEGPSCLTRANLDTLFVPSAAELLTTWADSSLNTSDLPITVYLPQSNSSIFALLDDVVNGFGLRHDAQRVENVADRVSETPGAIGVTSFAAVKDRTDLKILELNTTELNECASPSEESVANREYGIANELFLYANANLENEALTTFLDFVFSEDGQTALANAGFTTPGESAIELNRSILSGNEETGRKFSQPAVSFEIPPNITGSIVIRGSANPVTYLTSVRQQFSSIYPSVSIELDTLGEAPAISTFCSQPEGGIDILTTAAPLSGEEEATCSENGIEFLTYTLGTQATVLIGHEGDEFASCLTTDQVHTIWASTATDNITSWDQVVEGAPEQDLFTIAPGTARGADILLAQPSAPTLPLRRDPTESNFDPLYRAAAVSNVSGTITFMSWTDYQKVLSSDITGVQVIAIDDGDGCVQPTPMTISSNDYPYAKSSTLSVNKDSLLKTEVQSFLWYIFSDENYRLLDNAGFNNITLADLPEIRENLQGLYAEADALAGSQVDDTPIGFDPLARPDSDTPQTNPESTPPAEDQ